MNLVKAVSYTHLDVYKRQVYDRYQSSILGVQEVEREDVSKYGIVDGVKLEERVFRVKGLVEKPDVEKAPSLSLIHISTYYYSIPS